MSLSVTVKIAPYQEPAGYRLPAGRTFGYLLHDYDLYNLSRPSRNNAPLMTLGLPETVKALNPVFMPLTWQWQKYWVDLFSLSLYNVLYDDLGTAAVSTINTAFASTTKGNRAFTNGHGWDDGYADYINNRNPDAAPMEQETIITGGNVVELLSGIVRVGGKDVYKVATLDGDQPPPDVTQVNHLTAPWLIFKATISRREGYDVGTGKWAREDVVIPFDQLQGSDVTVPFMGRGTFNYIEAERIQVLPDSSPLPATYRK
jgi:hypothetical protein